MLRLLCILFVFLTLRVFTGLVVINSMFHSARGFKFIIVESVYGAILAAAEAFASMLKVVLIVPLFIIRMVVRVFNTIRPLNKINKPLLITAVK